MNSRISYILYLLLMLSVFSGVLGQIAVVNQIKTIGAKKSFKTSQDLNASDIYGKSESYVYSDALGRVVQSISAQASPSQSDLISFMRYNKIGMQQFADLVFTLANNNGTYIPDALTEQQAFYSTPPSNIAANDFPFAETVYKKSPLQQIVEVGMVGAAWQPLNSDPESGHTRRTTVRANDANNETVIMWEWDDVTDMALYSGDYPTGYLSVAEATDVNGITSISYTNKSGQLILTKVTNEDGTDHLKYNIYDNYDHLRLIVPPMAVSEMETAGTWDLNTVLSNWITQLTYDGFGRIVEKKIPESAAKFTVYDRMNRPILTQNGLLREKKSMAIYQT